MGRGCGAVVDIGGHHFFGHVVDHDPDAATEHPVCDDDGGRAGRPDAVPETVPDLVPDPDREGELDGSDEGKGTMAGGPGPRQDRDRLRPP